MSLEVRAGRARLALSRPEPNNLSASPKLRSCPTFGRKKEKKRKGNQTDLSAEPSVALLCRSSIFPAAAEVQPSERTQFHLTAHVSVINAKTSRNPPIDHRGPTDVQQRWETSRSVWPRSLVNKRNKQLRN